MNLPQLLIHSLTDLLLAQLFVHQSCKLQIHQLTPVWTAFSMYSMCMIVKALHAGIGWMWLGSRQPRTQTVRNNSLGTRLGACMRLHAEAFIALSTDARCRHQAEIFSRSNSSASNDNIEGADELSVSGSSVYILYTSKPTRMCHANIYWGTFCRPPQSEILQCGFGNSILYFSQ